MDAAAASSFCVNYNLRKASLIVSKVYTREMRGAPVRGRQFGLLMQIAKRPNSAISELARVVGADRTTGLIVSQLLTLYTTPVTYLMFDRLAKRVGWRMAADGKIAESTTV
jgi:hypothetical protein